MCLTFSSLAISLRAEKAGSISLKLQMRTLRHRGATELIRAQAAAFASLQPSSAPSVGGGSQKAE